MVKQKLFGCCACPLANNKEKNFVIPVEPENPDVIILFSVHGKEGSENNDLTDILKLVEANLGGKKAIMIASQNCQGEFSLKSLKACREAYNKPILDKYKGIPVLVLGEKAGHVVLGYKCAMIGKSGMAGKVLRLDDHDYYFTYGDLEHREHIKVMLGGILGSLPQVEWKFGMPEDDFWNSEFIILDIEHSQTNPYLGGKIDCIGISNDKSDIIYCILSDGWSNLSERLKNYSGILGGHNISSDLVWLYSRGWTFSSELKIWDTMIHRKTRPDAPVKGFGLKYLLKQDYKWSGYEALVHGCWHREEIPALSDLALYNAYDVLGTKMLLKQQMQDNRNASTFFLAMDYEFPMIQLMHDGIYVNPDELNKLDIQCQATILKLRQEIQEIVGVPVIFANDEQEEEAT